MPSYKSEDGKIYFIDDVKDENLLPLSCVKLTEIEESEIKKSLIKSQTYQNLRLAEYPPITDYIDGVVKGDTVQQQKYIDDCNVVKTKYPK